MTPHTIPVRLPLCALMAAGLMACATVPPATTSNVANDDHGLMRKAAAALLAGDAPSALRGFGDAAARSPGDTNRQTLLALAYQQSAGGDPETLDVAAAGYDLALRGGQDAYWAAVLAGKSAYDRGRYGDAENYFAQAVLARPQDARALLALAMSAYLAGDPQLAAISAERAALDSPMRKDALRIAALAYAASGQGDMARMRYAEFSPLDPGDAPAVLRRISDLTRTQDSEPYPDMGETAPEAPDQVSVDVAIILSQTSQKDSIGLNLLDGLQAQYGFQNQHIKSSSDGAGIVSRTITDAITIPQLTYNLNLFNRFGQYYQVVARPMLTAYRGEPADFFVGRSAKIAVGGVNVATLENIDIGTDVKVTPLEIDAQRTKLKIEVTRSFLSAEPAGTFNEALNTWRQTVSTTVEVDFGSTLILSGLSESVRDSSLSKTPVLGDAPIVGSLFNKRITTNKRDAVLILVTPSPVRTFAAQAWARPAEVERLIAFWDTVVAPGSDMAAITRQLEHARLFTHARRDDARLTWPDLPRDEGEIVKDLLLP